LLLGLSIFFFKELKKPVPTSVPSPIAAPVARLTIEQLPVREKIQPEIIPEPKSEPIPEPEKMAIEEFPSPEEHQPEIIPEPKSEPNPEPGKMAIEELPSPEELQSEIIPGSKPEPRPEPVAVAQEACTVEGGGTLVPPSLIHELQKMVEQAKYYPSCARRANITGLAILRLTISRAGMIQNVETISTSHRYLALGAKKTGERLLGKSVSVSPLHTIEIEVPIRYVLY